MLELQGRHTRRSSISFFGVHRDFKSPPPALLAGIWRPKLAPMIRLDDLGRRRIEED